MGNAKHAIREHIAELQYEAGMYKSLYDNAISAPAQPAAMREKIYGILYEQLDLSSEVAIELAECGNLGNVTDAILAALEPAVRALHRRANLGLLQRPSKARER